MNKGELIEAIANDANITKAQAQAAMEAFTSNVTKALKSGDKVTLVGFGTFHLNRILLVLLTNSPNNIHKCV